MPTPGMTRGGITAAAKIPLPISMIMTQSAKTLPCVRSGLVAPALPLPALRLSKPTKRLPSTEPMRYANVTLSPSSIMRCLPAEQSRRTNGTAPSLAEPRPAPLGGIRVGRVAHGQVTGIERRDLQHEADFEQLVAA